MSSAKRKTVELGGDWEKIAEIFLEILELPPDQRFAAIDARTVGHPEWRTSIAALLDSHRESSDFLEKPPVTPASLPANGVRQEALAAGSLLGDFEILSVLGRGAFATVYRARELSLGRVVALKVSPITGSEARTLARLEHDHIVQVFSETADEKRGLRMICMQYVPGITLEHLLREMRERGRTVRSGAEILELVGTPEGFDASPSPERETFAQLSAPQALLHLAAQLARALDHAHEKHLLHADVKPANILIHPDGRAYLADFNVARERRSDELDLNPFGGTVDYMAPEQLTHFLSGQAKKLAEALTPSSDVYSLGVVLRELFVASGILDEPQPDLIRVLRRATEAKPADRYASGALFAQALDGCRELDRIRLAMPRAGAIVQYAYDRPLTALTVGGFVIQFLASLISVAYNSANIVSHLSVNQQHFFQILLVIYNPFCFVVGTTLWLLALRPLHDFMKSHLVPNARHDLRRIRYLRRNVRRVPWWVFSMSAGSWLPGSLLFPFLLGQVEGPLPPTVFAHFTISFVLSFLVAASCGLLYADIICLRCLYVNFWDPQESIRATAARELGSHGRRVRACQWLVGAIPLIGALAVVWMGPDSASPEAYVHFRDLVMVLIGIGLAGLRFALSTSRSLTESFAALTGRR